MSERCKSVFSDLHCILDLGHTERHRDRHGISGVCWTELPQPTEVVLGTATVKRAADGTFYVTGQRLYELPSDQLHEGDRGEIVFRLVRET